MSNKTISLSKSALIGAVVLMACLAGLDAAVPKGWRVAGSRPQDYEAGVEQVSVAIKAPDGSASGSGLPTAYLRSRRPISDGFGTLMQNFPAGTYAGHRLQFTAFVRTQGVQDWAGLWVRIDSKEFSKLANMQDRPIKGTTDWKHYGITLDVPPTAKRIAFGLWLAGTGTVWMNRLELKTLGVEGPGTDTAGGKGPVNLDFQSQ
jgi:hypothetical protein